MARRCAVTGKGVMSGNNVSHAKNRTRRRFLPNLQIASFLSEALGQVVRLRVSTHALRTIEFKGGIDSFLAKAKDVELSKEARGYKQRIKKSAIQSDSSKAATKG